jgi:hypothetical protein
MNAGGDRSIIVLSMSRQIMGNVILFELPILALVQLRLEGENPLYRKFKAS